ncbi:MAG TPA: ABC transporter ATP-binding protein [Chloroflexota bacterium]|nr:ABC transporter ATP-binding protein [Chloroflexota bacterium]
MAGEPLLRVEDLVVDYAGAGSITRAVDGVNLDVYPGEFLGLVGESACGKSTLLFAIARLLSDPAEIVAGRVTFQGRNLVMLREKQLRHLRWKDFSVVMQSAMNALNPVMTIEDQLLDVIRAHDRMPTRGAKARAAEVLRLVGIDPIHLNSYPHQLSGGMRQRAMIAMALIFTPDLILADEPTSALDVVAQRSLMIQIKELQRKLHFAVIFVTHDMSLVGRYSDRIAIMYAGQLVETAAARQIFAEPQHPYTQGLLRAYPSIHGPRRELVGIPGRPPDLRFAMTGCRFEPRCPVAEDRCSNAAPDVYHPRSDGFVRCFLHDGSRPASPPVEARR